MKRLFSYIVLLTLTIISGNAVAASLNSALTHCAAMDRDLLRLSCYDELAGKSSSLPEEAVSLKSKPSLSKKVTAAVVSNASSSSNFGLTGKSATLKKTTEKDFGLKDESASVEEINSSIIGEFTGWKKGDLLKLKNGQIWKIVDSSNSLYHRETNPQITIYKGVFDSYRIRIHGVNKSSRVVRIK